MSEPPNNWKSSNRSLRQQNPRTGYWDMDTMTSSESEDDTMMFELITPTEEMEEPKSCLQRKDNGLFPVASYRTVECTSVSDNKDEVQEELRSSSKVERIRRMAKNEVNTRVASQAVESSSASMAVPTASSVLSDSLSDSWGTVTESNGSSPSNSESSIVKTPFAVPKDFATQIAKNLLYDPSRSFQMPTVCRSPTSTFSFRKSLEIELRADLKSHNLPSSVPSIVCELLPSSLCSQIQCHFNGIVGEQITEKIRVIRQMGFVRYSQLSEEFLKAFREEVRVALEEFLWAYLEGEGVSVTVLSE
ncbi:hypothetical protein BDZ91DRAFT_791717 [Kalaharituber pfeilii]|nr:hypothetical protein BDZ91DRAFT_791717 [Kalaharituber pfeilii]